MTSNAQAAALNGHEHNSDSTGLALSTQKRLDWVDAAKGIGIVCIVLGHMNLPHNLKAVIYSFHVPLFFFIAGYLFNNAKYQTFAPFVKQRIQSLIVPYIIWSLVGILFNECLQWPGHVERRLIGVVLGNGGETIVWFIACLFTIEVFGWPLIRFVRHVPAMVGILTLMSLVGHTLFRTNMHLPWSVDTVCTCMVFYVVGNAVRRYDGAAKIQLWASSRRLIILLALAIVTICGGLLNPVTQHPPFHVDLIANVQGNYLCFYVGAFSGIAAAVVAATLPSCANLFRWCGRNSLAIMVLHLWAAAMARVGIRGIMAIAPGMFGNSMATSAIQRLLGVAILLALVVLVSRSIPMAVGRRRTRSRVSQCAVHTDRLR